MRQPVEHKFYSLPAACAALFLTLSGCPDWLRDALQHRDPSGPPPTAAGSGATAGRAAPPTAKPTDAVLPTARDECPTLETGEVTLRGIPVELWVGEPKPNQSAPLIVYWHGTGSSAQEAPLMLGDTLNDVLSQGGIVAAPKATTGVGTNLSTGTWYTGDFEIIDELVACAKAQRDLDTRRIFTTGCSSGGIQAGGLAYQRSNYIAAAALNSGGLVVPLELQDPARVPAVMTIHGTSGQDVVIVNFADTSHAYADDLVSKGGFAVDCNQGGGHCQLPNAAKRAAWDFLNAHPYGIDPEPYAGGLPDSFPSYCQIRK